MIKVKSLKPSYTEVIDNKIRIVFSSNSFSIFKDDNVYNFLEIEGKEIIINLNNREVENISEIFVFQCKNHFLRLPLYQLLLVSDVHEYLLAIYNSFKNINTNKGGLVDLSNVDLATVELLSKDVLNTMFEIEKMNIKIEIDNSLKEKDKNKFYKLTNLLKEKYN